MESSDEEIAGVQLGGQNTQDKESMQIDPQQNLAEQIKQHPEFEQTFKDMIKQTLSDEGLCQNPNVKAVREGVAGNHAPNKPDRGMCR